MPAQGGNCEPCAWQNNLCELLHCLLYVEFIRRRKMINENEVVNIDISSLEIEVEPVYRGRAENLFDRVISEEIPKTLGKSPKELEGR